MKNWTKKRKLIIILGSVVVVCGLALGVMYATGVFPNDTQGAAYECLDPNCDCHDRNSLQNRCNGCEQCTEQEIVKQEAPLFTMNTFAN